MQDSRDLLDMIIDIIKYKRILLCGGIYVHILGIYL